MTKIARLNPFSQRVVETREINLGKVLLFCEGTTEVLYFEHFARIIRNHQNKYSELDIVPLPAEGDARRVLNFAEDFLSDNNNARQYSLYEKHLVFDCDAPSKIQEVVTDMKSSDHKYSLLVSNLLFESWLLMHYEYLETDNSNTKRKIYTRLSEALGKKYKKSSAGLIRQIIGNGDNVRNAISHAGDLEGEYIKQGLTLELHITQMIPYTTVHLLMERIMSEMQKREQ